MGGPFIFQFSHSPPPHQSPSHWLFEGHRLWGENSFTLMMDVLISRNLFMEIVCKYPFGVILK